MLPEKDRIILEYNLLMFKFMGGETYNNIISKDPEGVPECVEGLNVYHPLHIPYHQSWDWIMPVVEKLEEFYYPDNPFIVKGKIVKWGDQTFIGKTKLDSIYKSVVYVLEMFLKQTN